MSAANKKYQQLKSKVHIWKTKHHADRVVDFSQKEEEKVVLSRASTSKYKCRNCGHIMFYQAKTCPNCDKSGMFEEVKE